MEIPIGTKIEIENPGERIEDRYSNISEYKDKLHSLLREKEKTLPQEMLSQVCDMTEAVNMMLSYLGIAKRFDPPKIQNIHLYSPTDFDEVDKAIGGYGEACGAFVGFDEIIIKDEGNHEETLSTLNHELLHYFSYKIFYISEDDSNEPITAGAVGLRDENTGMIMLNEIVTEITSAILIKDFWRKFPSIRGIESSTDPLGYKRHVEFGKMLFQHIASHEGEEYDDILHKFQRQMFVGNGEVISILQKVFGAENLSNLIELPRDYGELGNLRQKLLGKKRVK